MRRRLQGHVAYIDSHGRLGAKQKEQRENVSERCTLIKVELSSAPKLDIDIDIRRQYHTGRQATVGIDIRKESLLPSVPRVSLPRPPTLQTPLCPCALIL